MTNVKKIQPETTPSAAAPMVYQSIADIIGDLSKIGIAKDSKNTMQNYKFRGIDDIYNALAPLLAKHRLIILPRVLDRELTERATKSGGALFYVVLTVDFDFISAVDGSRHTVTTLGEAMDSGDKATNKAMSAAYKYACLEAFCIPTEGDNDADATTHEVAAAVTETPVNPLKEIARRIASQLRQARDITSLKYVYEGFGKDLADIRASSEGAFTALEKIYNDQLATLSGGINA